MQKSTDSHLSYEHRWKHFREPACLALTAGFIDTVGFVGLFGLFTNHVTGNLILAGAAIAGGNNAVLTKLLAIPVFIAFIALTAVYIFKNPHRKHQIIANLFIWESALLLAFMLTAIGFAPLTGPDSWNTMLAGMLGVAAMGVRIALARLLIEKVPHSTIMTGNVSQLTIDAIIVWLQYVSPEEVRTARLRIRKTLPAVIAFVIGSALGCTSYLWCQFYSLSIPTLIMFALGVKEYLHTKPLAANTPIVET